MHTEMIVICVQIKHVSMIEQYILNNYFAKATTANNYKLTNKLLLTIINNVSSIIVHKSKQI